MRSAISLTSLFLSLWILCGCGTSSGPQAQGGIPVFTLVPQPAEIAPSENAQLYLFPDLPDQFEDLAGEEVWFSSSAETQGFFNYNLSMIDLDRPSYLNPEVWYQHIGSGANLTDTIYAHCISQWGDTLAWDSCLVKIIGNQ